MNIQKIICLAVELKVFSSASDADNTIRHHLLSLPPAFLIRLRPRAEANLFSVALFGAR